MTHAGSLPVPTCSILNVLYVPLPSVGSVESVGTSITLAARSPPPCLPRPLLPAPAAITARGCVRYAEVGSGADRVQRIVLHDDGHPSYDRPANEHIMKVSNLAFSQQDVLRLPGSVLEVDLLLEDGCTYDTVFPSPEITYAIL